VTTTNLFSNRATAKLAVAVSAGDTALTLVAGGGAWFPTPAANQYFRLVVQKGSAQNDQREYMLCTGRTGDVLTVTRGLEGTPATAFAADDEVSLVATGLSLDGFAQKVGVTLQGALEVEADPTTALGIATKQMVTAAAFPEAPADGKDYARKDVAWHALGAAAGLAVPIPVTAGGTGGTTVPTAQTSLGINTTTFDDVAPATPKYGDRWIRPSSMIEMVWAPNAGGGGAGVWINPADAASQAYPIPISKGGTGGITAAEARTNLGVVALAGDTMTGFLTLSAAPTANLHAATKLYVDGKAGSGLVDAPDANTYGRKAGAWVPLTLHELLRVSSDGSSTSLEVPARAVGGWASVILTKATTGGAQVVGFGGALGAPKQRWGMMLGNGAAESGSNVGSDFVLDRYTDAGAWLAGALIIYRSSGDAWFGSSVYAKSMGVRNTGGTAVLSLMKGTTGATTANIIEAVGANGATRWQIQPGNSVAETGSGNVGTDFGIYRYADNGAFLGSPLTINRAAGNVYFESTAVFNAGLTATGNITASGAINVSTGGAIYATHLRDNANPVGSTMVFHWSGQTGTPSWVWGASATGPGDIYVWNPATFSVNYANSAASCTNATNASWATTAGNANAVNNISGWNYANRTKNAVYVWATDGATNDQYLTPPSYLTVGWAQGSNQVGSCFPDNLLAMGFASNSPHEPYMRSMDNGVQRLVRNYGDITAIAIDAPAQHLNLYNTAGTYVAYITFTWPSDERLKRIHGPATRCALDDVAAMNFISYNFDPEKTQMNPDVHHDIGFSGQNLQGISERYADVDPNGMLAPNAQTLLPLAFKAIAELMDRVKQLENA
jgi:hypothetical protein